MRGYFFPWLPQFCFPDLLPLVLEFLETTLICSASCLRRFTLLSPHITQPAGGGHEIYTHVSLTLKPVSQTTGTQEAETICGKLKELSRSADWTEGSSLTNQV